MAKKKRFGKKPGAPPGTLVFTGEKKVDYPYVTRDFYNENDYTHESLKGKELPNDFEGGTTWLDVRGLSDIGLIEQIGKKFDIHPLILEDVLNTNHRPKYEEYEEGIFLVLQSLTATRDKNFQVQSEQVSIFLKDNVVITFQEKEEDVFESIRERLNNAKGRIRTSGPNYLAYALLDNIIDNYFIVLDHLDLELEDLEMEILNDASKNTKSKIYQLKQELLYLRKYISPLRETTAKFLRSDHRLVPEFMKIYLNDVYDHVIQILDMVENQRDLLNGLYDLFLSEISFRMNSVMQVLTVISTIFIPLGFFAGVYGMNFHYIPELNFKYGYFIFWICIISLAAALLYVFKRKKWL